MSYKTASKKGATYFRGHGYNNRVWKVRPLNGEDKLAEDTEVEITDYKGNREVVFASELQYS